MPSTSGQLPTDRLILLRSIVIGASMAVSDTICKAIRERRVLTFAYKGGVRTVEPYIFGYDDHDVLALSAVQTSGGSGLGFRTFHVDSLSSVAVTEARFFGAHRNYNRHDPYFARIICQV
jgi:hypothetical protein